MIHLCCFCVLVEACTLLLYKLLAWERMTRILFHVSRNKKVMHLKIKIPKGDFHSDATEQQFVKNILVT